MTTMIALLRGVNVGGKILKMDQFRATLAALDCHNVQTYLQSGNAVFEIPRPSTTLGKRLQAQLAADTDLDVTVFVRSPTELRRIVAGNPFLKEKDIDPTKLHVTFLTDTPTKNALESLSKIASKEDRYFYNDREIYLYCPNGYGRSKLNNSALEARLALRATTRNWNTVSRLCELASI